MEGAIFKTERSGELVLFQFAVKGCQAYIQQTGSLGLIAVGISQYLADVLLFHRTHVQGWFCGAKIIEFSWQQIRINNAVIT